MDHIVSMRDLGLRRGVPPIGVSRDDSARTNGDWVCIAEFDPNGDTEPPKDDPNFGDEEVSRQGKEGERTR